jgi:hypothetical protein
MAEEDHRRPAESLVIDTVIVISSDRRVTETVFFC